MENKTSQFISIAYKLYVGGEKEEELMEEATAEQPFQFISGFSVALDAFEQQVVGLEKGQTFDFSIAKEQAYGDYSPEHVLDLDREIFSINGHFDHDHIYEDAIIPLQNDEGNRFYGRVVEVGEDKVKVDLNHPLAGETLHFVGKILENRPATPEEISHMIKHMSGEGCGCHCDDCEGGCEGGCESHHEHHDGCGCGHCH